MKAPKCKICGEAHYGPCNTFSIGRKIVETTTVPGSQIVMKRALVSVTGKEVISGLSKFDRVAYQREYMRKYRAKKKQP